MRGNILVSILINNYNYGAFLSEAIESALAQTYHHTEVIVVDDGSTDNSREIINAYRDRIVTVFKENAGQASAFNAGFAHSRGDVICFLDADDVFEIDKISKIIDLFEEYSEVGWIIHKLSYIDGHGQPLCIFKNQDISDLRIIDARERIRKGKKVSSIDYATSALCFRRKGLDNILPMPEPLRINSDTFIYFASFFQSPGLYYPEKLAIQRIHGANYHTFRPGIENFATEMEIKTIYYVREKFPEWSLYGNRLFASSLGRLIGMVGKNTAFKIIELNNYIDRYFSTCDFIKHSPRIIYNYFRGKKKSLKRASLDK